MAEAVADPIRPGSALALFPTKALAQDQLRAISAPGLPGLVAATYDGDCSTPERTWVRRHANVVLTNPDMLHCGLLPHHARWATFLMRLRYVVVDELHVFRGVFGTHVAHLLRRLRRICALYGSRPTFVFCSATIGRPAELASALTGLDVAEVTDDGSPRGERLFALWNPPLLDPASGARASANAATADLMAELVTHDLRTLAFCRSRKGAELVAADVEPAPPSALGVGGPPLPGRLPGERAARDRGGAVLRAAAGRGRHQRARARESTSVASTPACSTASPARSPRCGSRRDAPDASSSPPSPCWSPARTSSTST